ncbi:MAG: diguanylate cyclase [Oscillospiraceae bacterium]|nr:diguanylate cyclase [Oscillospiraceae bacterium]
MEQEKNSILIIEDQALSIRVLSDILQSDYAIYIEKKSTKAFTTAKTLLPDLILLDIMMPEKSGFEVIAELKNDDVTKDIPVIFVTGLSNPENETRGLSEGAADYINKPYTPAIVKMRVQHQMMLVNLIRKLQMLSSTDELTGLRNRRDFMSTLQREWGRAKRDKSSLGVLMIDIDYFKDLNDTYGHINGDVALVQVAQVIRSQAKRPADMVARWGGEEFAVILPSTHKEGVGIVAEVIRKAIENHKLLIGGQSPISITVSIGTNCITPNRDEAYTAEDLISDADKALYKAKQDGRNRVCAHQ